MKREIVDVFTDTRYWKGFEFRDDDTVISTYHKAGTTWMQQIASQIIFNGKEGISLTEISPWLDMRIMPIEKTLKGLERQEHPRIIKTHSPADAIPIVDQGKYILVARDGRDIVMSMHNHFLNATDEFYQLMNEDVPDDCNRLERPGGDIKEYFKEWVESDGIPVGSFFDYMESWQDVEGFPNVLLVHYNNLKKDLSGEIERIADFLDVDSADLDMGRIVNHCSFDYMKERSGLTAPVSERFWTPGTFFYKGINDRWKGVIEDSCSEKYERILEQRLGHGFAHWTMTGEYNEV